MRKSINLRNTIKYKKSFFLSVTLTYIVTIAMSVFVALLGLEEPYTKAISFYNVSLSFKMYIMGKIVEAIIPTTITFLGVTLAAEAAPQNTGWCVTIMVTCIPLLGALYISIATIKNTYIMIAYLGLAVMLSMVGLGFSKRHYLEPTGVHFCKYKSEMSDGLISG